MNGADLHTLTVQELYTRRDNHYDIQRMTASWVIKRFQQERIDEIDAELRKRGKKEVQS